MNRISILSAVRVWRRNGAQQGIRFCCFGNHCEMISAQEPMDLQEQMRSILSEGGENLCFGFRTDEGALGSRDCGICLTFQADRFTWQATQDTGALYRWEAGQLFSLQPQQGEGTLRPGMLFLLCDSNLCAAVPRDQLERILRKQEGRLPADMVMRLVKQARLAGCEMAAAMAIQIVNETSLEQTV